MNKSQFEDTVKEAFDMFFFSRFCVFTQISQMSDKTDIG